MAGNLIALFFVGLVALAAVYRFLPGLVFDFSIKLVQLRAGLAKKTILVNEQPITYFIGGTGKPLLLLHGFGADKTNWLMIAPHLVEKYQLIIPDLPGFGESPFLPTKTYSVAGQIDTLERFVKKLGLNEIHLAGNSMGGYLAAKLAEQLRGNVESVWLLAPAGVTTDTHAEGIALIESGDNPLIIETEAAFDRLVELCFETPPPTPQAIRTYLFKKAKERADINRKLFAGLIGGEDIPEENPLKLEDCIAKVPGKVLIVWGDKDRILHPDGLGVLLEKLKETGGPHEGILMSDMGHIPMVERPKETASDFLRFVSEK